MARGEGLGGRAASPSLVSLVVAATGPARGSSFGPPVPAAASLAPVARYIAAADGRRPPPRMDVMSELYDACTTFICIASALHAAINFEEDEEEKIGEREEGTSEDDMWRPRGPHHFVVILCVQLTCGPTFFFIFPRSKFHVNATSMPCGTNT